MSAPDLGELRALLAAGTPGPWGDGGRGVGTAYFDNREEHVIADCHIEADRAHDDGGDWLAAMRRGSANATLIAAAVNTLPALLDELEAAREQIATLTAQRDRAERGHERLETGVEALAGEWQQDADGVDLGRGGFDGVVNLTHRGTLLDAIDDLRALLAETTASEERA